jgi:DNA primase
VIVVEGYMDVVALAQHGIANAVATLGTATTSNHVHKLLRQASKVVFCFDGDNAGRKAAWRALEASLDQLADDKSVGFLFLPVEHDPDSYVRAEGADAFRRMVAHPVTLSEFLLRHLLADIDLSTAEGRARLVHEATPHLQKLSAPVLRTQVTKAVAVAAALTQAEVEGQCGIKPLARNRTPPRGQKRTIEVSTLRTLLKAILERPERAARLPLDVIPHDHPEGAALHFIADKFEQGELPPGNHGVMLEFLRGSLHEAVVMKFNEAVAREQDEASIEKEFEETLENLRYQELESEIAALTAMEQQGRLSAEERRRLAELLSEKNRRKSGKLTSV